MSLRDEAAADLTAILNDTVSGFGFSATLTDQSGVAAPLNGLSNDISQVIDPDTGTVVTGRNPTIGLSISDINSAVPALDGLPVGVNDPTKKPWLVSFNDINGNAITYKVSEAQPDRSIGLIMCVLELYNG